MQVRIPTGGIVTLCTENKRCSHRCATLASEIINTDTDDLLWLLAHPLKVSALTVLTHYWSIWDYSAELWGFPSPETYTSAFNLEY